MTASGLYSSTKLDFALTLIQQTLPAYLKRCQQHPAAVQGYEPPTTLYDMALKLLQQPDAEIERRLPEILGLLYRHSRPLQSPHYIGHQVAIPLPWAAALEAVSGVLNQGSAIWEMGPFVLAAERAIAKTLAPFISQETGFEGVVTNGGTLANLTALLAARNTRYPGSFSRGVQAPPGRPAVITSEDAHYSIARSLGVMGLGSEQVLQAPVDPLSRKIDTARLSDFYFTSREQGFDIFALVASACSTPTGAIDDLDFLATFCAEHGIWLHVDAAHGGGFLLSPEFRPRFAGIDRADSVTWDAHKMMFVPALCTFVFFKDKKHSYQTFSQDAPYLFDPAMSDLDFESGLRTFECTKGNLVLPLFAILCTIGTAGIARLLEGLARETRNFHQLLEDSVDFEALHVPETNILCFRYLPGGVAQDQLDQIQDEVRARLLRQGDFYLTGTLLRGKRCLRVSVMNPLTTAADFQALLENIRGLQIASAA